MTVVRERGGDASDKIEVSGEYVLQFGKYKGKCFRWLLENYIGYTIYLIKSLQLEEAVGDFLTEGHSKDSLLSFVSYAQSFEEIQSLLSYISTNPAARAVTSEDNQLVGFGSRAKSAWLEIWDSKADGYASFIMKKTCVPGTRMYKLQQYLWNKQRSTHPSPVPASKAPDEPMGKFICTLVLEKKIFAIILCV